MELWEIFRPFKILKFLRQTLNFNLTGVSRSLPHRAICFILAAINISQLVWFHHIMEICICFTNTKLYINNFIMKYWTKTCSFGERNVQHNLFKLLIVIYNNAKLNFGCLFVGPSCTNYRSDSADMCKEDGQYYKISHWQIPDHLELCSLAIQILSSILLALFAVPTDLKWSLKWKVLVLQNV